MRVLYRRCAGLDVHQRTVVACLRSQRGAQAEREVRTFATTSSGLLALGDWLEEQGCEAAVMESTGVYWKPVWHLLEGRVDLTLANAQEVRNLPGRKSDVQDAEWLADLHAHGLVRGSFVPPTPIQELRDLTRTRTQLVREMSRHVQRLHKTLQDANVKLTSVLTDIVGVTGRAMLEAMIAGKSDVVELSALRRGPVKATAEELQEALRGRVREHHRFMLRLHLDQIDALEDSIEKLDQRIARCLEPFRPALELLTSMPAVREVTVAVLLAELGPSVERFPTAGHLLSWAGLCPKSDESAGKRRSTATRHGNRWLKAALIQAAWPAVRVKGSYHQALFLRLRSRRGPKKAIVAVAASMLTAAYFMLLRSATYAEPQPRLLDATARQRTARRLLRRLRDLGIEVEVKPAA